MAEPVGDIARGLQTCLAEKLTEAGRAVCQIARYNGRTPPPWDICDCRCGGDVPGAGQAWVRVVEIDAVVLKSPSQCNIFQWWAKFELGVARCVAIPDGDVLPGAEEQGADFDAAMADAQVMRQVIRCCSVLADREMQIEPWKPLGPSGGCGGGAIVFGVELQRPPTALP